MYVPAPVNVNDKINSYTVLEYAHINKNPPQIIKLLIDNGADVDETFFDEGSYFRDI